MEQVPSEDPWRPITEAEDHRGGHMWNSTIRSNGTWSTTYRRMSRLGCAAIEDHREWGKNPHIVWIALTKWSLKLNITPLNSLFVNFIFSKLTNKLCCLQVFGNDSPNSDEHLNYDQKFPRLTLSREKNPRKFLNQEIIPDENRT